MWWNLWERQQKVVQRVDFLLQGFGVWLFLGVLSFINDRLGHKCFEGRKQLGALFFGVPLVERSLNCLLNSFLNHCAGRV